MASDVTYSQHNCWYCSNKNTNENGGLAILPFLYCVLFNQWIYSIDLLYNLQKNIWLSYFLSHNVKINATNLHLWTKAQHPAMQFIDPKAQEDSTQQKYEI